MEQKVMRCEDRPIPVVFNFSWLHNTRQQLLWLFMGIGLLFPVVGQSQVHTYLFDNNFNSSSGGPTLTELVSCGANPGTFGPVTTVNAAGVCLNFNAYCFEAGGGFKYPNTGPYVTGGYTISMYVRFNSVTSWTRLLDFENSTSDAGLYIFGGCLEAIPWQQPVGPCPSFQANTFYLITLVRDPTTFVSDIYVNGVFFSQLYDSNYPWLRGTTNGINFFRDDNIATCEAGSGCIAFMQVSPVRATAADVAVLWSNLPTLIQSTVSVPPNVGITPANGTLNCATTSMTLTATGGGTYVWNNGGQTTAGRLVDSASTYTVTVTDINGCTASASSVITKDITPPTASISPAAGTLTCATTSINLTATGGAGYNWGGGLTTATRSVTAPATYTVTVTGANGCTATANATIGQNITPPTALVNPASAALTCSLTAATITASGGTSYNWGGGITTAANTVTAPGTYPVTVTGTNGCTATASSNISQNTTPPVAAINPAGAVLTCAATTATLTASGGTSYNWGGGITTAANTANAAGNYTVTVTAANGCTASATVAVTQNTTPPVAAISPSAATLTCSTASITLTASGGASYNWGGGITTVANTVTLPNTYTVTVTDANGCTATASTIVGQNINVPIVSISPATYTLNCINTSVTLTAAGGTTYNWSDGSVTATTPVTMPGSYTVTATGTNGCTASTSVPVLQDITTPAAAISPANAILDCNSTSVLLTASGGGIYNWGPGITTTTHTISTPATYTVTVTGSNGCTAVASSIVTQDITPPAAVVSPASATLTCANTSTTFTASGGAAYNWGGGIVTAANTISTPGTYNVTVTGTNGCTASASAAVTQTTTPPVITISPATADIDCITSQVTLTATGGGTYNWGGGITTAANTVTTANTYTVTSTDANGCSASASAVVTLNTTAPAAAINASATTLTCSVASITLTAAGGGTYDWGNGITTATNAVSLPNTYVVTVTGTNGCTATASSVITQDITAPIATVSPTTATITCITPAIAITAGGAASYNWGGGIVSSVYTVTSPNTYTVTATGANGCTATASVNIVQDITTPNINIAPAATLTCAVLSSNLQASSTTLNAAYDWGSGVVTASKTVSTPGNYSVTVTDPANGCTISSSVAVAQDIVAPAIAISNTGTLNCISTSVTINATSTTPNVSYDWGGGNTTTSSTVTSAGSYAITVTNPANSCTASAASTVVQDIAAPPVNIVTPAQLNCINASVTIQASSTVGAATYDWGNGTLTPNQTVTIPASYSVTVTDPSNGCTATATTSVVQNHNIPAITIVTPDTITCHSPSVILSASTSAVVPAYNWGSGNTGSTYAVSVPGTYTLTITDNDNGCSATAFAEVFDVPLMVLSETHTNISCFGFNDGTIDLTVTGGQSPFSFAWSNGGTNEDILNTIAGTQTVTVTDNISCTATAAITITEPASMVVTETHNHVTCFGNNNGSINVTVSAGIAPYAYRWNDLDPNEDRAALAPGTYTVTATDNNSCSVSIAATITEPTEVTIQPTLNNPTCATNGNDGSISVLVNGGTTPYSYAWSNSHTTDTNANLGEGPMGITVTDANSCVVTDMYTLAYQYNFVVDAAPSVSIKLGESTMLDYTLTGNTGNYTSAWTPDYALSCVNCVSPDVTPVYSKLYTITVTNDLGCVSSDTMSVTVVPLYEVFVPNAFTPNGDGVNDLFSIYGNLDGVEYMEIKIFNRLGEKVYESSDHQFTWDGSYKGELQTAQIFTWQMKLTWLNGHRDELRKGTLTLFK